MLAPLGDQAGPKSSAGSFVRFVWLLPSAFMTKISESPALPRYVLNAICVPSGDHVGSKSPLGSFVRFSWFVPSEFMTQMSSWSPSYRVNAIFVPSGDQAG